MSHKASAWAMDQKVKTPLEKLVLLILADCHNAETGACFPSLPFIAGRASCTTRGVIKAIESLEKQGLIGMKKELGKVNQYAINPGTQFTREHSSPVNTIPSTSEHSSPHPRTQFTGPMNTVHPNLESNLELTGKGNREYKRKPSRSITKPEFVSDQVWSDFTALRQTKRSPITQTALDGIDREAKKAGITLNDALRMCCERGWQGFKASWIKPEPLSDPKGRVSNQTLQTMSNLQEYIRG